MIPVFKKIQLGEKKLIFFSFLGQLSNNLGWLAAAGGGYMKFSGVIFGCPDGFKKNGAPQNKKKNGYFLLLAAQAQQGKKQ